MSPYYIYKFGHNIYNHKYNPILNRFLTPIYHIMDKLIVGFIYNSFFPAECTIGEKIRLPHPYGIFIHKEAIIGDGVVILHQVTIGGTWGPNEANEPIGQRRSPIIGNNVVIGAGAKIIGPVRIGDHTYIGANAVVTKDIPSNKVAVGIPAKVISDISQINRYD